MPQILAIDPGREKCGIALVDVSGETISRKVIATEDIVGEIKNIIAESKPDKLIIGSGTYSKVLRKQIKEALGDFPLIVVDESHSTEIARTLYFKEYPPKGLWRLVPIGLQIPPVPYDDFAAIVLAKNYLSQSK